MAGSANTIRRGAEASPVFGRKAESSAVAAGAADDDATSGSGAADADADADAGADADAEADAGAEPAGKDGRQDDAFAEEEARVRTFSINSAVACNACLFDSKVYKLSNIFLVDKEVQALRGHAKTTSE